MNPETPNSTKPTHRRRSRLVKVLGSILITVLIALWVVVRHIAPALIVEPPRSGDQALTPEAFKLRSFRVEDGISLAAWENKTANQPLAAIIVLHGIADSKASQEGTIRSLAERNILAIAPDLRAHGQSGGLASYGFHEKKDISLIIDDIALRFPGIPIGIWGTSYGGAVALQSAAHDPRIKFAIIESTFANLPDMARQQASNFSTPLLAWLAPFALTRAGELATFPPYKVSPEQAIRTIDIPILHFHGTADEVIPFKHGERISQQSKSADYRFVPIQNGGHYGLQQNDPKTYQSELERFLRRACPLK